MVNLGIDDEFRPENDYGNVEISLDGRARSTPAR
jgi:hypothetical protein